MNELPRLHVAPRRAGRAVRASACIARGAGRARAEQRRRRRRRRDADRLVVADRRRTEGARPATARTGTPCPPERQQQLLRGTRRWLAMTPEQRRTRAGALFSAGRICRPSSSELARKRWHSIATCRRTSGSACARTTTASRSSRPSRRRRLRERWQNATPEERQRMLERRRAAPGTAGSSTLATARVAGAGVAGIFFDFVPGSPS